MLGQHSPFPRRTPCSQDRVIIYRSAQRRPPAIRHIRFVRESLTVFRKRLISRTATPSSTKTVPGSAGHNGECQIAPTVIFNSTLVSRQAIWRRPLFQTLRLDRSPQTAPLSHGPPTSPPPVRLNTAQPRITAASPRLTPIV